MEKSGAKKMKEKGEEMKKANEDERLSCHLEDGILQDECVELPFVV